MTYTEDDHHRVTLEMSEDEWASLLIAVGIAATVNARAGEEEGVYRWLRFANDMNATNPRWLPYNLPQPIKQEERAV